MAAFHLGEIVSVSHNCGYWKNKTSYRYNWKRALTHFNS